MTDSPRDPVVDEAVAQLTATFTASGFPRMPAAVLMALMTSSTGRMTAEELGTAVSASAAAISGATRYLVTVGLVVRHTIPGTRRHVYELPDHTWYTATLSQDGVYRQLETVARRASERLGGEAGERMTEMADFFAFLRRRIPDLLEEWRQSRA